MSLSEIGLLHFKEAELDFLIVKSCMHMRATYRNMDFKHFKVFQKKEISKLLY